MQKIASYVYLHWLTVVHPLRKSFVWVIISQFILECFGLESMQVLVLVSVNSVFLKL